MEITIQNESLKNSPITRPGDYLHSETNPLSPKIHNPIETIANIKKKKIFKSKTKSY